MIYNFVWKTCSNISSLYIKLLATWACSSFWQGKGNLYPVTLIWLAYGSLRKNCNQKRRILDIKSKRTKSSLAQLTDSASYSSIRFHLGTYSYCNKQKLTSCILIIPNFVKFRDIIIYVAWWWEKYLSKRSLIKHTCSWRDKLVVSQISFQYLFKKCPRQK